MADFFDQVFDSERAEQRKTRKARRPWWQLSTTVRQGLVMSALYFVLGVGGLIVGAGMSRLPAGFAIIAAGWLLFSACYLISALALRRRSSPGGCRPGPVTGDRHETHVTKG